MGDGGFERLLGAPGLDGLQLVLREAIQNSCDAAKLGSGPRILIRLRTLTAGQIAIFRDVVLKARPFVASSAAALETFLASDGPKVLEICDFGTTGLGGPTRADRVLPGGGRTDFIDFMRNVGTRRKTDLGGGTYGFGKASLYRMSRCSTVIVDTLAHEPGNGTEARRLIGCHLGNSGEQDGGDGYLRRYTGRHWWGANSGADDGAGEPLTGNDAATLWEALGGPSRNCAGETGTTIMILDPELRMDTAGQEPEGEVRGGNFSDFGIQILERVLWNFWPRMLTTTPDDRRIDLTVEVEGVKLETPRPENCPPLDLFARAINTIRSGNCNKILCHRPFATLGALAINRGIRADRLPAFRGSSLFPARAAHIALMRPAEMVVCYLPGPPLPDERTEWAGVFVTSNQRAIEEAFASAEPAAHETWDPTALPKGHARTYVNVAITRLKEAAINVTAASGATGGGQSSDHSVASVAGKLGAFLAGIEDDRSDRGSSNEGGGGGGGRGGDPQRRRINNPVFKRLETHQGQRTALFAMTVSGKGHSPWLNLTPTISIDGGGVPAAALDVGWLPRVLGIEGQKGHIFIPGTASDIGDYEGELTVRLTVPDNCAVGLRASLLPETSQ
ncbi:hypothetical protein AXW83_00720 [Bosea sp. PAMC 26642]|nr:hypothetical protein AXW83_00720 [Bosea sp. PAMC 26642]